MPSKTVKLNKQGISGLPNNKPVVYKIQTVSGANNYTGIAQRGRVQERIAEHLSGSKDPIPGVKVQIEQMSRSLSDLGDRSEHDGRARANGHDFEAHSGPTQREIGGI